MARFKNGPWGGLFGAIGPVEAYMLNGQLILRSKRSKSAKLPSEKQLACRLKLKMISEVLGTMTDFLRIGFAPASSGADINAYNAAVASNIQHAISGTYQDYQVSYANLQVARGSISNTEVSATVNREGSQLIYSWTDEHSHPRSTDHAMLLAYCPEIRQAAFNLCGNKRKVGHSILTLPEYWAGQQLHCYLAFREASGSNSSNSMYV
ncbi:DUF6266 family protein [Chitinophaga rhizophila]|uniref:Uncharacterized protein n=1 Tax=Chitinophaga rhizophila TaxID=2866212 RepID=A0ABS7GHU9_9BACT|nr:DUF6266 family protein [Chitinophaga rhizophila]MBW8687258.1 hypothetical protein [Chitinophaga rhizophila]